MITFIFSTALISCVLYVILGVLKLLHLVVLRQRDKNKRLIEQINSLRYEVAKLRTEIIK